MRISSITKCKQTLFFQNYYFFDKNASTRVRNTLSTSFFFNMKDSIKIKRGNSYREMFSEKVIYGYNYRLLRMTSSAFHRVNFLILRFQREFVKSRNSLKSLCRRYGKKNLELSVSVETTRINFFRFRFIVGECEICDITYQQRLC